MKIIDFDGTRTDTPGLYRMTADQYHADPCITPSLSSSIAKVLLNQTPKHAFAAHPRYTKKRAHKRREAMVLGEVVHALLLGKGRDIVVLDFEDWRTKASQEKRDAAEALGKTVVLIDMFNEADKIAETVREALPSYEHCSDMFQGGFVELVVIWQEPNGAMCRAMLDHVDLIRHTDAEEPHEARIADLKTSGVSIDPEDLGKRISDLSYEISAAFYMRGLAAVMPELKGQSFRFAFVETGAPYEVVAAQLGPDAYEIGRRQVCAAIHVWRMCQLRGEWPGFKRTLHTVSLPEWKIAQWELREIDDKLLEGVSY